MIANLAAGCRIPKKSVLTKSFLTCKDFRKYQPNTTGKDDLVVTEVVLMLQKMEGDHEPGVDVVERP
jgi:hypothetical protein